jgi:hypothetical protein
MFKPTLLEGEFAGTMNVHSRFRQGCACRKQLSINGVRKEIRVGNHDLSILTDCNATRRGVLRHVACQ